MPIVPPPAVIASAIERAIGVRMHELPMSPGRVRFAIERHGNGGPRWRRDAPLLLLRGGEDRGLMERS